MTPRFPYPSKPFRGEETGQKICSIDRSPIVYSSTFLPQVNIPKHPFYSCLFVHLTIDSFVALTYSARLKYFNPLRRAIPGASTIKSLFVFEKKVTESKCRQLRLVHGRTNFINIAPQTNSNLRFTILFPIVEEAAQLGPALSQSITETLLHDTGTTASTSTMRKKMPPKSPINNLLAKRLLHLHTSPRDNSRISSVEM